MKLRILEAAAGWRGLLLATLLYPSTIYAADDKTPSVIATKFDRKPTNVQYFKDSDTVLFQDYDANTVYRSENAGETWDMVKDIPMGDGWDLWMHPVDPKKAFVITRSSTHYMTNDRGKSWKTFETGLAPSMFREPITYHASEPDKMLFNGMDCQNALWCTEETKYTSDGFSTPAKRLRSDTAGCYWAKTKDLFNSSSTTIDENRILCIVKGKFSPFKKDYRLLISDDYFLSEHEPNLEPGRTVTGIGNIAMVKKYVVAAASSTGTDEMALYVSDDTVTWHRAIFPKDHKLEEDAYTMLESSYYSLQVDVLTSRPSNPMGVLFTSNSNGTFFTRNIEHTDRNFFGLVDFEKATAVQGIYMVNTVANWEEVEKNFLANKKVQSQITFDDGRTFEHLTVKGERLHLHSVTDLDNSGKVFSSLAPGIMMGIGNTGDHLEERDNEVTNTYVSDNAGRTWNFALKGAHKYEFGDEGSILLAIRDRKSTNEMSYSLNHGKDWKPLTLPNEVIAQELTTTFDATSQKFVLVGVSKTVQKEEHYIMSIDFSKMNERTCTNNDMERWYTRVDDTNNPTCLMGHKTYFLRRKADADCFVKGDFQEPLPIPEPCDCTDQDFECDYNFIKNEKGDDCIKDGPLQVPDGACAAFGSDQDPGFKGSSGFRLIPGNDCRRTSGSQRDDPKEYKCSDANRTPATGRPDKTQVVFKGETGGWKRKVYLERADSSSGDDETIIMQTGDGRIHLTRDHGKTWEEILEHASITQIITNPYFNDVVYFLTSGTTVYYSTDRGNNIRKFEANFVPDRETSRVMTFHPRHKDWFIWTGAKECDSMGRGKDCHAIAQLTKDRGDNWNTIARYVRRCEFIYDELTTIKDGVKDETRDKLIYCEVRSREDPSSIDNPWKLIGSADFFEEEKKTYFEDIVDFATMNEFIVVATRDEKKQFLKASASMDGQNFAPANFPSNFKVDHEQAYTVLDSHTHAVFMHVTVSAEHDFEYGSILKSNSNGTNYVKIIDGINRDQAGFVDFEKMHGLEGVALVNKVANHDAKGKDRSGSKKLKSMITHDDGAEWTYLKPPALDSEGKKLGCSGPIDKCSLHIHSYTEREDKSRIFSSQTAIGLLFGIGNVGEYLGKRSEADTFISKDAGVTWEMAKKGSYMWKFGDQGSIIVLVDPNQPTNVIHWSKDEGKEWKEFQFSDEKIRVDDLTTTPTDSSRNFLIWSKGASNQGTVTINIDFTGLTSRQCTLDEEKDNEDYYFWSPKHPNQQDGCLFGHVSQYHRKKIDADCFNGPIIQRLHNIASNCSCTRADFECDFNFERKGDGSCELVDGLKPKTHLEECAKYPDLTEYYESTGYRRIPLSTCEKGNELEYLGKVYPCPGKEEEFQKKHGIGPWGIFFAVMIPIGAAAGVGYYVWSNWANKFGQIRLGEQSSFNDEAPFIKYPIMLLSALVAIAQALPLLAASLWRSASSAFGRNGGSARGRFGGVASGLGGGDRRFTTRDSFARGRGDYAVVDEDEGELLGEESDEEV